MTIHDIALTLQPQIGPRTAAHLVDVFQTAENLYNTPPDMIAQRAMLRPDVAVAITKKQYHSQAERELRFCENNEITYNRPIQKYRFSNSNVRKNIFLQVVRQNLTVV